MKKIPSVWQRGAEFREGLSKKKGKPYVNLVTPGCEWVLAGEGVATRKWDGTSVLVKDGQCFARFDAKNGKTPPPGFIHAQDPDLHTGHWPGWVPTEGPTYQWIREAFENTDSPSDGTYEACGPKINGNQENLGRHFLLQHGLGVFVDAPREFEALKAYLALLDVEGVVFHHPDGRMAKATKSGFGLQRKP